MALWQGTLTARPRIPEGTGPRDAYWMLDPGGSGRYVLGTGAKEGEAAAFQMAAPLASAPYRYVLSDDRFDEDRPMKLIGDTRVRL
jgi:hypothetical protein